MAHAGSSWAVAVAALLALSAAGCVEAVDRPGGATGPAGPGGAGAAVGISILAPAPGASVARTQIEGGGLFLLVNVARLPEGARVRFAVRAAGAGQPLFDQTLGIETGRLTADATAVIEGTALARVHALRITVTALDATGAILGDDAVDVAIE
jgi:hypothetical protein